VWFTPGGWVYFVPYVLYENAMMIVKTSAMCAGLLQWSNAHEWVVTAKLGKFVDKVQHSKVGEKVGRIATAVKTAVVKRVVKKRNVYGKELAMGCFFLTCAAYGTAVNGMWQYGVFLCLQGGVFVAFGLDYVDSA
jgi:beta-mannan synthase